MKNESPLKGVEILHNPSLNKGSGFTLEERKRYGLEGLLPARVHTITEQCERSYQAITRKTDPLEQYIGLTALQDRNETLFYRLLLEHIEQFLPIVYTPTVGQACQQFSHIFRKSHGLWITPDHRGRIAEILSNYPHRDIRLIVVTDNERILGLGDQGAGGMGIPIGKLALYTMGAGIHPTKTLPISLDVGTDNQALLKDPLYLGYRQSRLRGETYQQLVAEFVEAVKQQFPKALLQWEDFKQQNAFDLLDKYRDRILSFNDDIQGTAAIAAAGVFASCRATNVPLTQQRILILGAGAAGIGIARLLKNQIAKEGIKGDDLTQRIAHSDSQGMLVDSRTFKEVSKKEFAWPAALAKKVGISEAAMNDFEALIEAFKPSVLIGTSGQPNTFTEKMIKSMAAHCKRPVIMPFSNPTANCEAQPVDLIRWTDGRALVATGSPFQPVIHNGRTHKIGQGNNVYIFPGVGLGCLVAEATKVTDEMFAVAAGVVASMVSASELESGALYPPLKDLRKISTRIAEEVVTLAQEQGVGRKIEKGQIPKAVADFMWYPDYKEFTV